MNSQRKHLNAAFCALLMALSLPGAAQKIIDLQGHRGARGLGQRCATAVRRRA